MDAVCCVQTTVMHSAQCTCSLCPTRKSRLRYGTGRQAAAFSSITAAYYTALLRITRSVYVCFILADLVVNCTFINTVHIIAIFQDS